MERNSTSIFNGFTAVSAINAFPIAAASALPQHRISTAPSSTGKKYVSILIFPIRIFGRKSTARIISRHAAQKTIMLSMIVNPLYFSTSAKLSQLYVSIIQRFIYNKRYKNKRYCKPILARRLFSLCNMLEKGRFICYNCLYKSR